MLRNITTPKPHPSNRLPKIKANPDRALRLRLERENASLRSAAAARARQHADEKHAADCQTIVLLSGQRHALDSKQVERVANIVESHRKRFAAGAGNAGKTFPLYDVMREAVAKVKGGLAPARDMTAESAPSLPPPVPEARPAPALSPAERAFRERQSRDQHERGRAAVEAKQRDREAYLAALKRLGLTDPALGYHGGSSGFGM